jgi:acetyltransferase-like isoleucine patch superfamily enzyme
MKLGDDVVIDANTKFTRPGLVSIGNHVAIDWGFYCTTALTIGDYVHISPHVAVIGGASTALIVGDFCFISVGARMLCASEHFMGHGLIGPIVPDEFKDRIMSGPIVMQSFSGVCANSVVMPGITMGQGSILGANSFLKGDAEPWTIYAGNPARPIKDRPMGPMIKYAQELKARDGKL